MANFTSIHHQNLNNSQYQPNLTHNCKPNTMATLLEARPKPIPSTEIASTVLELTHHIIPMSIIGSPANHLLPSALELYEAESRPLPFLRLSSSASDSYDYFSSE